MGASSSRSRRERERQNAAAQQQTRPAPQRVAPPGAMRAPMPNAYPGAHMMAMRGPHRMYHPFLQHHHHAPQAPPVVQGPEVQESKTVKNKAAIIKKSIKLEADATGALLKLVFEVDSLTDGTAKAYLMCKEHLKGEDFRIDTPFLVETAQFGEGEGVEVSIVLPEEVAEAQGNTFALCVGLWYTDDEEVEAGQFTYFNKSGSLLECARQCLWVGKELYCLEDIYGLEVAEEAAGAVTASIHDVEDEQDSACVVCMVEERDTTVMPCRHMCLCRECANHLRQATNKCPICRTAITSLLHLKKDTPSTPPPADQLPASTPPAIAAN
eukprot:TRINITY_DN14375_c0_g1_i1.p1 TRINITY_DN14375_c0_g1~~TRINITY_DN14375_c0_g1_i1.p1  ORF type:complete len:352 (+),score=113.06 TRINITY_DN14375_c0_g1_i1:83-1057(+)